MIYIGLIFNVIIFIVRGGTPKIIVHIRRNPCV
jgi:hypothetical protein